MSEAAITPFVYAGFWRRKAAYGVDVLLVLLLSLCWSWLLGRIAHAQTAEDVKILMDAGWLPPTTDPQALARVMAEEQGGSLSTLWFDLYVSLAVSAFYNIYFLVGGWQATPGKHWLGMKVVRRDGRALTVPVSIARHLMSGVSIAVVGLGYITMAFSRE